MVSREKLTVAFMKKHLTLFNKLVRKETYKLISKMKADRVREIFKRDFREVVSGKDGKKFYSPRKYEIEIDADVAEDNLFKLLSHPTELKKEAPKKKEKEAPKPKKIIVRKKKEKEAPKPKKKTKTQIINEIVEEVEDHLEDQIQEAKEFNASIHFGKEEMTPDKFFPWEKKYMKEELKKIKDNVKELIQEKGEKIEDVRDFDLFVLPKRKWSQLLIKK